MIVDVLIWVGGAVREDVQAALRAASLGWLAPRMRGSPPPKHRVLRTVNDFVTAASGFRLTDGCWVLPTGSRVVQFSEALGTLRYVTDGVPSAWIVDAARDESLRRQAELMAREAGPRPRLEALDQERTRLLAFTEAWGIA